MELHFHNLKKYCRICGSGRRSIEIEPSRKITSEEIRSCLELLEIDTSSFYHEDAKIYPKYVCYICFRKLNFFKSRVSNGKSVSEIEIASFENHSDDCKICKKVDIIPFIETKGIKEETIVSSPEKKNLKDASSFPNHNKEAIDLDERNNLKSKKFSAPLSEGKNVIVPKSQKNRKQKNSKILFTHEQMLLRICRVCGISKINLHDDILKTKLKKLFCKVYDIDVLNESSEIYPPAVCNSCLSVLHKDYQQMKAKNYDHKKCLLYKFEPHQLDNCYICRMDFFHKERSKNHSMANIFKEKEKYTNGSFQEQSSAVIMQMLKAITKKAVENLDSTILEDIVTMNCDEGREDTHKMIYLVSNLMTCLSKDLIKDKIRAEEKTNKTVARHLKDSALEILVKADQLENPSATANSSDESERDNNLSESNVMESDKPMKEEFFEHKEFSDAESSKSLNSSALNMNVQSSELLHHKPSKLKSTDFFSHKGFRTILPKISIEDILKRDQSKQDTLSAIPANENTSAVKETSPKSIPVKNKNNDSENAYETPKKKLKTLNAPPPTLEVFPKKILADPVAEWSNLALLSSAASLLDEQDDDVNLTNKSEAPVSNDSLPLTNQRQERKKSIPAKYNDPDFIVDQSSLKRKCLKSLDGKSYSPALRQSYGHVMPNDGLSNVVSVKIEEEEQVFDDYLSDKQLKLLGHKFAHDYDNENSHIPTSMVSDEIAPINNSGNEFLPVISSVASCANGDLPGLYTMIKTEPEENNDEVYSSKDQYLQPAPTETNSNAINLIKISDTRTLKKEKVNKYCEICNKDFKRSQHYRKHMLTHTRSYFGCPKCSMKFVSEETQRRHMLIHEKRKQQFKCPLCCAKYKTKFNVMQHLDLVHQSRCYIYCETCYSSFKNEEYFNEHTCFKNGSVPKNSAKFEIDQPSNCRICNREFNSANRLVNFSNAIACCEMKNNLKVKDENVSPMNESSVAPENKSLLEIENNVSESGIECHSQSSDPAVLSQESVDTEDESSMVIDESRLNNSVSEEEVSSSINESKKIEDVNSLKSGLAKKEQEGITEANKTLIEESKPTKTNSGKVGNYVTEVSLDHALDLFSCSAPADKSSAMIINPDGTVTFNGTSNESQHLKSWDPSSLVTLHPVKEAKTKKNEIATNSIDESDKNKEDEPTINSPTNQVEKVSVRDIVNEEQPIPQSSRSSPVIKEEDDAIVISWG